ncbi:MULTISPECIES: iron-containing redox enzyme family protein [Bacillus]|uniref:Iron-containing redox enzyme family protein n=1 Tax=Bacillus rugosus TaxID=2715209 RepID=A0ACD3ZYN1_9BACI|nr:MULTISPECIES: iron-containing redox enzyme family protein [Bacillus]MBY4602884.1 iron-containing redox enzyme family protein [Bacillus sp. SPARC3]UPV78972.1 iron-containing redox enzyme family protein [Bacillus rugosus]
MKHELYFEKPKLRKKVRIEEKDEYLQISYHGFSLEIFPNEKVSLNVIKDLLNLLDGKHSLEQICEKVSLFSKEEIINYINELDEHWLLTEGTENKIEGKSGLDFIFYLEDLYAEWQNNIKETELTQLILNKGASKNLIVGFAVEYYHVTRRCHECISPAVAKSQGRIREKVLDFFMEEYRHDKLLMKSLLSFDFDRKEIENSVPLPYTQAIMNMLSKWAHTDLLSFMAGIFLFEGTDYDGMEYKEALSSYNLPKDFVKYQNTHGDINIKGEHGQVTRDFYRELDYISPEDQIRVVNNIRMLNELHIRMHQNTIDYYNQINTVVPRNLDKLMNFN